MAREGGLVTKKALLHAWFNWETFVQCCYNYERMMGLACAHVFVPIIYCLYKDDPSKRKAVMRREAEFFNVHIEFGACILGLAIALEEQMAMGEDVPGELITNLKTALMGPLAGVGDTIWQGVVIPILLGICIDLTLKGAGIWGPILYTILICGGAYAFSYINFMFGYRAGSEAVLNFIESGKLDQVLTGASIMGCMVMGGLIVNYVKVTCGIDIVTSGSTFNIQADFFDQVLPKALPLAATMGIYALLNKRWSSLKIIGLIVAVGIVFGATGILTYA
ncbi:PTS mannose transporter subunit IIAB [Olsenella sp. HMSC062G07]|nr:PTS mannose transporter subunit IIAB [Olsenella sp. HMSC062G07]